ncbi:MAG: lytic transglycosylase domain-containing protein [Methylovulum sp.]|uniref:lytic transglycosylase domain-containing protein n=1 Tax=Methylovulum sp. TaxID=1916980 RepID=UPI00260BB023|nr:lytic transglycosylase domain-containing protein [Methylovulum sp.]MDD2725247.1 lytic transglycosylase domain-containing protein [Methylovulum sp.]MDD5125680.1 lytic transglycosylase domain-containing protein [Methylovulum sp.]
MPRTLFIVLILSLTQEATADIYKYVDSDGRTYYTDEPKNGLYKRIIKSKAIRHTNYFSNTSPRIGRYSSANKMRFAELIAQTAAKHQVDAKLVHAVIQTESAYNSGAVSPKGAVGLMQLMPATAQRFGVMDSTDPNQNVDGGTRYLKHLIAMFEPNIDLAVAAYNAGENAVIKYNNSIPPYPETQNYVRQVLALYNR